MSREVIAFAALVASSRHPVLLDGETGSGKTFLAREIHRRSARSGTPFVRVNCAAIPDSLFEREMFGHVRGAFTDAREGGTGFFEAANHGTLFLDEIGEIPLAIQPKLLAVLEEGVFWKLGAPREIQVDVKIIAATSRNLSEMVQKKQFRQDLFYRLSVLHHHVAPLRERRSELPELVRYLLQRNAGPGVHAPQISARAMHIILQYSWPGNTRELDNALCAASVFAQGALIEPEHLPHQIRDGLSLTSPEHGVHPETTVRYTAPPDPEQEVRVIEEALRLARGNKTVAARRLGMSRSTLWVKLQRYGMDAYAGE
jgi:transcriptional regulator with PAS, ATPase and Fis domain